MNNTLIKGLGLLETLSHADQPMGVTELARQLAIGKSTVHRLLQALVEQGYVRRNEASGSYAASIKLWELGSAVLSNLDLRNASQSWMAWLLERSRETVHLSVLDGDEVVYVHKLDSPEPVRAYSHIGGRAPAHCVATGKAMLAFEPMAQLKSLSRHLQACSPRTLTVPAEFLREMERIREQGYAVNRGEWRESVGGVAAPVRDPGGAVIAAIGVSGPIERLRPARLKTLSTDLIRAADGITAALRGEAGPSIRTPSLSPALRAPLGTSLSAPLRATPKKARQQ